MDEIHPQNTDKRPKRRKDRHNPYTIFSVGMDTVNPHYYVSFKSEGGLQHCVEISKDLFDEFDRWELEDISFMHEIERHYEHSELTEQTLNKRALLKPKTPEQIAFQALEDEALICAMNTLTVTQYRRLILYFWEGMSYKEIGMIEGCKYQAVQDSIERACKKIRIALKKNLV